VDKLAKIGTDSVQAQLEEILGAEKTRRILDFIGAGKTQGTGFLQFEESLAALKQAAGEGPDTERLETLLGFMKDTGTADSFVLDPSITRGLDYYTGVVYESFLDKLPGIGSVCSGGRYDNLSSLYSKEPLPGVGSSIGLDRLQAALEELGTSGAGETWTKAAIVCQSAGDSGKSQMLAEKFRSQDIPCEVFLEPKKLTQQFMLAEKKSIPWVIIPPADSADDENLTLRNITRRENKEGLSVSGVIAIIQEGL
jgi:histidyl-tRNA synthetase